LQNLNAISFTKEIFTKHNFVIFSKMCGPYFHDLSRSQVAARIYSSERWKNVLTHFGSSPLPTLGEEVLGAFSRFMHPKTKMFPVKFRRTSEQCCHSFVTEKYYISW